MLATIKSLLFEDAGASSDAVARDDDGSVAAALLIQAALADGEFSDDERAVISTILVRDHGASVEESEQLIAEIEDKVRDSVQLFGFTQAVNDNFDMDKKISLMETLWEVILADGVIDHHEDNLMRRLSGLLHVPDRESGLARQRVQARAAEQ